METSKCPDGKIINPATGRCVLRSGKIGQALLKQTSPEPEPEPEPKSKPTSKHATKSKPKRILEPTNIPLNSHGCKMIGMMQTIGTCWFNAIFNSLLLSQKSYSFFLSKYKELPSEERKAIEQEKSNDSCPLKLQKSYFFKYFYKYHKKRSHFSQSITQIFRPLRYGYGTRHPEKMLNNLGIREKGSEDGGWPSLEIQKLMHVILDPGDYIFVNELKNNHHINNQYFVFSKTKSQIHKAPNGYILDHVVIVVQFKKIDGKTGGHAISGYICNGDFFIFDSNKTTFTNLDWRNLTLLQAYFKNKSNYSYIHNLISIHYDFICYTRL
jgi:hypothetical protein